jgi:cysteine synthase
MLQRRICETDEMRYIASQRKGYVDLLRPGGLPSVKPLSPYFQSFIKDREVARRTFFYILPLLQIMSGNGKTPPAWRLLQSVEPGRLIDAEVWVPSSGNTVANIGIMKRIYRIRKVVAVVNRNTSKGKIGQLVSCRVEVAHPPKDCSTIQYAREMSDRPGRVFIDQYTNWASVEAHEQTTWPHFQLEMEGRSPSVHPSVICVALGTTSSFVSSKYLKKRWPGIMLLGVSCKPGEVIPGARDEKGLEVTGFGYKDVLEHPQDLKDKLLTCGFQSAREMTEELIGQNFSAGFTTGMVVVTAIDLLNKLIEDGDSRGLDRMRNSEGNIVFGFLGMDAAAAYNTDFLNP